MTHLKTLCVIPARGGSKGVPKKNIKFLAGKPLIYYTLESACTSGIFCKILISTDSDEIAKIVSVYPVEIIKRPASYSTDASPMISVLKHALSEEKKIGNTYDYIFLLQPTCPFRTANDIKISLKTILKKRGDSLISVYRVVDAHPARMYKIDQDKLLPIMGADSQKNRQDLTPIYHRNGAIYISSSSLLENGCIWGGKIVPYIMSKSKSINIDDMDDFEYAEYLIEKM